MIAEDGGSGHDKTLSRPYGFGSGNSNAVAGSNENIPNGVASGLIIDPAAFAGRDVFLAQMDALGAWLTATPARPGSAGVRLPGQRAMAARREQLERMTTAPILRVRWWAASA